MARFVKVEYPKYTLHVNLELVRYARVNDKAVHVSFDANENAGLTVDGQYAKELLQALGSDAEA